MQNGADNCFEIRAGNGSSHARVILGIPRVLGVFWLFDVADCGLGTKRNVTEAKKKKRDEDKRVGAYQHCICWSSRTAFCEVWRKW